LDLDGDAVDGRGLECVFTRVVAARGEFEAGGRREFEGSARGSWDGVCEGIEGERTGKGECGNNVGRSDESMSGGICVVAACKVPVVRSDD